MRGEGGILRNASGERFMSRYDEKLELAPRDVVSRSIVAEMRRTGTRTVYLDMTAHSEEFLKNRFPKIYETCQFYDLNIAVDLLPVSPASHYWMGGIRTDLHGRTTVAGLYAAGEVACTGVHGANRLASNSLLEGLVFGARAGASAIADCVKFQDSSFETKSKTLNLRLEIEPSTAVRKRVKRVMWERVGILRDKNSLERALKEFAQIEKANLGTSSRNFVTLAKLAATAALWRKESRGGHFRTDFPERDDGRWQIHSIQKMGAEISSSERIYFENKFKLDQRST
jgi:L-aspartate oxidase